MMAARIATGTIDCDGLVEASDGVPPVPGLRESPVVLHLDTLAPRTPRLPHRRLGPLQIAASMVLHVTIVVVATLIETTSAPGIESRRVGPTAEEAVRHVVFLAPELPRIGGGGGGGGNQQPGPIRRAEGVGADTFTLRVRKEPSPAAPVTTPSAPVVDDVPPVPSIVLDAKPLASGLFDQMGLPTGGVLTGPSTGPGSGGGVGTGSGTGIGSGRGLGLGPGSGGGIRRRRLPRWRCCIGASADQGSQA